MKFGDLQARITAYRKILKDDFDTLINFEPPPPMPRVCKTCGKQFGSLSWSWGDVEHEIELGNADKEYTLMGYCSTHDPYRDKEEEEAEDSGDDADDEK